MQPFAGGQHMQAGGYGQMGQPPMPGQDPNAMGGGAAPLSSPFGAAPAGGVRSSPFGAPGAAPAGPMGGAPPTAPFGGAAGGLAPPPSMADMAARQDQQQHAGFAGAAQSPFPGVAPGIGAPPMAGSAPPAMGAPPMAGSAPGAGAGFYPQAQAGAGAAYPGTGVQQPMGPTNDAHMQAFLKDLDAFNSPKDFVRASVSKLPNSISSKQKCSVPLGVVLQPLAPTEPNVVPDVNFGAAGGIVRCKSCRTYINPFVNWEANGRRWTCNLCGFSQVTPDTYYSSLDETGRRADRYQRPELCRGAVEYIAPGEYMVRPPQPPVFMFVIDVSFAAVSTGMLHSVVDAIKQAIQQQLMPGGQRLQIGIITYDTSLHFYNLNANLSSPQMLVVSDLEDLFLPLPDDILVNAYESESAIMSLLDSLPTIFQETKTNESCMGSAVKGAYLAMKHIGGKLLVFGSSIPSVGEYSLKSTRQQDRLLGTDKEIELLRPVDKDPYKELANELTRAQISVELFIGAHNYVDLASISSLAKYTGGDVRYYFGYHIALQGMKLKSELLHVLTRYCGWEAVMRVRVSRGWKITKFYGHLFIRGQDLLVVPNCHADQTFAVTMDMEENVTPDPVLCIQSALLYTNCDGERRIRVHTWAAPTTQNFSDIINSVDVQATTALLSNIAIDTCKAQTMAEGRNKLNTICQQVVQANNVANSETLAFLPLYINGMLKSSAFRGLTDVGVDLRTSIWMRLETLGVSQLTAFYYPRLMALHNLADDVGIEDENGRVKLPDMLNLTKEGMTQDGIYMLEDGETINVWIGSAADANTLQNVFGNGNIAEMDPIAAEAAMGSGSDPLSQKISLILRQVRSERLVPYMQVKIIKGGDGQHEIRFFNSLIEDRTMAMQSTYMEFLQRMGYRPAQQQAAPPSGMTGAMPGLTAPPGMRR